MWWRRRRRREEPPEGVRIILLPSGTEIACDMLRDQTLDSGRLRTWIAVPREKIPALRPGMPFMIKAAVLPAKTRIIVEFSFLEGLHAAQA